VAGRSDLAVLITLPGQPGTKTDFLDEVVAALPAHQVEAVLDLTGEAADAWMRTWSIAAAQIVRALLDGEGRVPLTADDGNDPAQQPHAAETGNTQEPVDMRALRAALPPPRGYRLQLLSSVPWLVPDDEDAPGGPLSTAFSVVGWVQQTDTRNLGLLLRVRAPAGDLRDVIVWGDQLAPHRINGVLALLRSNGLSFSNPDHLKNILYREHPDPLSMIDVVPTPGWTVLERQGGQLVHVGLTGEVVGSDTHTVLLANEMRLTRTQASRGTLAEWQELVIDLVELDKEIFCPHWLLGILLGLAGPPFTLSQSNSAGVVLVGESSMGKSISLRLAAGCWSWPSELAGRGAYRTFAQSSNNVENVSSGASGGTLALDETALANARDLSRVLYKLASGAGTGRMSQDLSEQRIKTWQTLIVTSSERSIKKFALRSRRPLPNLALMRRPLCVGRRRSSERLSSLETWHTTLAFCLRSSRSRR
jgi:hypothetical protein